MLKPQNLDALLIIPSSRSPEIIQDQIEAILWSCEQKVEIIVATPNPEIFDLSSSKIICNKYFQKSNEINRNIFLSNYAIKKTLEEGVEFEVAITLNDDVLPIGKGLDTWILEEKNKRKNVGVMGVLDSQKASMSFWSKEKVFAINQQMNEWKYVENKVPPKRFAAPCLEAYTYEWALRVMKQGFFGEDMIRWKFEGGIFQSWITLMAGLDVEFLTSSPSERPPVFHFPPESMPKDAHEMAIGDFKLFSSTKSNPYTSEQQIRSHFANRRNSSRKNIKM